MAYKFLKEDGSIYLLDSRSLRTKEIMDAYYNNSFEDIKEKISEYLASSQYRAERRITYKQLPIFIPLLPMIDSATISFFEGNYVSSYFTLVPIIEGLLLRWSGLKEFKLGTHKINNNDNRTGSHLYKFVIEKTLAIFNKESCKGNWWEINNLILLRKVIRFYFRARKYCSEGYELNRNISLHLLSAPEYFANRENTIKLFNFIDLIANVYEYDFENKIIESGKGSFIATEKYIIDELNKIEEYKSFYLSCYKNNNISLLKKIQERFWNS